MRRLKRVWKWIAIGLAAMAILDQLRRPREDRTWEGEVLGFVPYDLRPPTLARARSRWWNDEDERLFVPQVFGVGWTINFARIPKLLASAA
jgi:hypothetical protein